MNLFMWRGFFAAAVLCLTIPAHGQASALAQTGVIVGTLEDRPAAGDEVRRFVVRALFRRDADGWVSLDPHCTDEACLRSAPSHLPPQTHWTITLSGRIRGVADAVTPHAWARYADVGQQELAPYTHLAPVGVRNMDFAGEDAPVYRPLITLTAPNARDPDRWAPAALPAPARVALLRHFHAQFAHVENCTQDGENPRATAYGDADIEVSNAYASATGWRVATAHLRDYRCDGPNNDTPFAEHLFSISPAGAVRLLGEGLRLVDAGDYDADGASEIVFAILGRGPDGDCDGYELFTSHLTAAASFNYCQH